MTIFNVIWQVIRRYRWRTAVVLFFQVMSAFAEAASLATLLPLMLVLTEPSSTQSGVVAQMVARTLSIVGIPTTLPALLGLLVVVVLVKALCSFVAMREIGAAAAGVSADMRHRLLNAVAHARWSYFVDQPIGALTNALGAQIITAAAAFTLTCSLMAEAIQFVIYIILTLLATPWYMAVAVAGIALALYLMMHRLRQMRRDSERQETTATEQLAIRITDGLRSFKTLKAMGMESGFVDLLRHETEEINSAQLLSIKSQAILRAVSEPVVALVLAIGLYIAVVYFTISVSELLFTALLLMRMTTRAINMQGVMNNLTGKEVTVKRIEGLISYTNSQVDRPSGGKQVKMDEPIIFDKVSFKYGDTKILDQIDAEFPPGRMIVIRGPSGAGKTTLIDLLIGLHPPSGGRIVVNEIPFSEIDIRYWRSHLGYVPQESTMLQDTIANNISLGRNDVSDEAIESALRRAEAWSFVSKLPKGIHDRIGENGARLSGGEKQRVAIARALVHRPDLIILDEPTSALDAATAAGIIATLRRLVKDESVTILAITHHELVAKVADVLYELDDGQMKIGSPGECAA